MIHDYLYWTPEEIRRERERQAAVYREIYPNKTIPTKITKWVPKPVNTNTLNALKRAEEETRGEAI